MFVTDDRTERFMDSLGVKFDYRDDVKFSQFDPKWDATNFGRSQVRVLGAIEDYGRLMDQDSSAPAPIVWYNPKRKWYEVCDGIQRLLAAELRKPTSLSVYCVITGSTAMVAKVRVFANLRLQGGYQESNDWTLKSAVVGLINTGDATIKEVAGMGGWSPSAVRDKKTVLDFSEAVTGAGGPSCMADSVLRVIAKQADLEDFVEAPVAIADFANSIKRMTLSAVEAQPYIEKFFKVNRDKKLHIQFQRRLKDFHADEDVICRLADPKRKRYQSRTAEGKVLSSIKAAVTTAQGVLDSREPISEMAEYFQLVSKLRTMLIQIEKYSKKKR